MKRGIKQRAMLAISLTLLCVIGAAAHVSAYEVTLSFYNQGFDINAFYNNGDFDVEAGIVEADPSSLLVIVGDPANVEETLEIPEIPDPFELAQAGSDFHFGEFQPFRFPDRFNGLFSTTVDDPVLFVPDNGVVTAFQDDGLLADDRIDLTAFASELPPVYYEMDWGDTLTMQTNDGTNLYVRRIVRNADYTVTFDISDTPEPGTLVLLGLGLVGLLGMAFKKRGKMKMKKPFSFMMIAGVVLLAMMHYAANSYAYEIGPEFCAYRSESICTGFQGAYHSALGRPIGPATKSSFFSIWTQKFEKGYINCISGQCAGYSQAQDPAEVAIMLKWQDMQAAGLDIGNPISEIVGAWGSPDGTGGHVRFFENGDIYYHGNGLRAGQAFEVHGRIQDTYNREGGTTSFLGFPISDEKPNGPFEHPVSYFEGGCITSENGIDYDMVVKGCREGQPIQPPKLIDATASCVKSGKELTNQKDSFSLKWTPYVPSNFTLTFDPDTLSTSKSIELFREIGVKTNGYGEVSTDLIVVNEGYKISFKLTKTKSGVSVSGSDGIRSYEITPVKKGYKITIKNGGLKCTISPDSSSCDVSLEIWGGDLRIKKFIENLKKFAKFVSALDSVDDMLEKVRKAINVFKKLPASDEICRVKTGKMTYSAGYELSPLCCASSGAGIKDKHKVYGNIDADIGSVECDSPEVPIGYGFNIGVTASLDAGASVTLWGETTCGAAKVCFEPKIDYTAGLGVYVSFISKKLARADLKGKVNSEATWEDLCYDFNAGLSMGQLKICARPKVVGEVTGFGFLKYKVEANIGGKVCASSGKFSGGGFGGGGGGSW